MSEAKAQQELSATLARAGLTVPAPEQAEILAAWPILEELRRRVRAGQGYADEPAVTFGVKR
ncbi:MAG TPA: hypothetical protein VNT30_05290 [Stellaceae bacterium]|nr:hypothetical protein [Stellaceae bacterium]